MDTNQLYISPPLSSNPGTHRDISTDIELIELKNSHDTPHMLKLLTATKEPLQKSLFCTIIGTTRHWHGLLSLEPISVAITAPSPDHHRETAPRTIHIPLSLSHAAL
jgi:hypothetical protein